MTRIHLTTVALAAVALTVLLLPTPTLATEQGECCAEVDRQCISKCTQDSCKRINDCSLAISSTRANSGSAGIFAAIASVEGRERARLESLVQANDRRVGGRGGAIGGLSTGGGSKACKSCTGMCQTLVWAGAGDIFYDVDLGGGMSPSQCIDAVAAKCGQGYATYLFKATCGN